VSRGALTNRHSGFIGGQPGCPAGPVAGTGSRKMEGGSLLMKGQIVRLVRDRGFGFVRAEAGQEYFFHATGIENRTFESLGGGESVEFDLAVAPRANRERAVRVRVVG